ncbi:MAG: aspartate kinase [Cyanobacteriota bacterium]|nr:aspartate kinase [Cyanobacteriota bacterium]
MSLIVQKYGGTSVGSIERIRAVARRVQYTVSLGHQVVVVVSAMGHETDRLVDLATGLATGSQPLSGREMDMLLATGEQVSIALLSMALHQIGCPAISMTGSQAGILTSRDHTRARILEINSQRLHHHLQQGEVVVVAGFQGVSQDGAITTLGRGGSDTTAVAVAVALRADLCEIYTDVPGVFTTDPRKVPAARLLPEITSTEMLELASLGAQVLHPRSVEIARNFGMKLKVLSSLDPLPSPDLSSPDLPSSSKATTGTLILSPDPGEHPLTGLEAVQAVNAVSLDRDQVKIALLRVPDRPGVAALLFQTIAEAGVNVDLILQSIHSTDGDPTNDIAFTVPKQAAELAEKTARQVGERLGCPEIGVDADVAKVSIGGVGMIGRPGIAADMFRVLAKAGINLQMISMSEIKVSCVIAGDRASDAALLLGEFFQVIPHSYRPSPATFRDHPVRGVALDLKQSRLAILQVPDRPGVAVQVFGQLAAAGVLVNTIIQSQRHVMNGQGIPTNDMAFTVPHDQAETAKQVLESVAGQLACAGVVLDPEVAKVSVVGSDMEAHPGVAARMFQALARAEINIEMIATSEIKVSCVVPIQEGEKALQVIHAAFELERG